MLRQIDRINKIRKLAGGKDNCSLATVGAQPIAQGAGGLALAFV